MSNNLGIDVLTKDCKKLMRRLKSLKSTLCVENGGSYREDNSYSQIHIETTFSEEELDHWLWSTRHVCDYVGVFAR